MRIGKITKLAAIGCVPLFLSGCSYTSVPKAWWKAWKNPPRQTVSHQMREQPVFVDTQAIVRQHPAWKLADAIHEKADIDAINIATFENREIPDSSSIAPIPEPHFIAAKQATAPQNDATKSTFNGDVEAIEMEEPERIVSASVADKLETEKSRQLIDWDEWEKRVSVLLEEDRNRMGRVLRSELYDAIQQETRGAFTAQDPYLLSEELQREMIRLRLRMIENLAISPQERQQDAERLNALEEQWRQKLKLQAQETAREQQYWRQTVPQQLREKGEAEIQKTLQALGQRDDKLIHSVVLEQSQALAQDTNIITSHAITQPRINTIQTNIGTITIANNRHKSTFADHLNTNKSTFTAPAMLEQSPFGEDIRAEINNAKISGVALPTATNQEQQLRQIALSDVKRAISRITSRHRWRVIDSSQNRAEQYRDVTEMMIRDLSF